MRMTLGQKLAYLAVERATGQRPSWQQLTTIEKKYIESLIAQLEEIESKADIVNISADFPQYECQTENPYLQNKIDFFLCLLLIESQKIDSMVDCSRLLTHLNDCYKCFEIFCQVIRDFYFKYQELSQNPYQSL